MENSIDLQEIANEYWAFVNSQEQEKHDFNIELSKKLNQARSESYSVDEITHTVFGNNNRMKTYEILRLTPKYKKRYQNVTKEQPKEQPKEVKELSPQERKEQRAREALKYLEDLGNNVYRIGTYEYGLNEKGFPEILKNGKLPEGIYFTDGIRAVAMKAKEEKGTN